MTTISLLMIKGMLEIKLRNEEFDLRTAIRVIEIDRGAIRGGKMSNNVERVDE